MRTDTFTQKEATIKPEENTSFNSFTNSEISDSPTTLTHAKFTARINQLREKEVELNLVEFASGSRADEAALETEACSIDQVEKGDCTPNDFFVRVSNKTISLPLSADATLLAYARAATGGGMIPDTEGNIHSIKVSLKQLIDLFKNDPSLHSIPFHIITTNGKISSLEEQYVP